MKNILLISGSLRTASYNTALLKAFEQEMQSVQVVWGDIQLPLFNAELEADFPPAAEVLRQQIMAADAIVIATPEYNRAMTGALKNALDWASRPNGDNAWEGKRVLVAGVSPGGIAAALAVYQVKQSLLHLKANVMSLEFFVGNAGDKFDDARNLIDEKTKSYVTSAVQDLLQ